jgi:hypothetical protein
LNPDNSNLLFRIAIGFSIILLFGFPLWVAHIARRKGHKEWVFPIIIFTFFGIGILPSLFALLAIRFSNKVAISILLMGLAIPVSFFIIVMAQNTMQFNRMNENVAEYVASTSFTETNQDAYITGKYIILPQGTAPNKSWYEIYPEEYPHGISASLNFETIGTIIVVDCKEQDVRNYTNGGKGYQAICKLTIIDKILNAIVDQKSFTGEYPPSSFVCDISRGSCDYHARYPFDEMKAYISNIPQK